MLLRERALEIAKGYLGVKEDPPDSNRGRLIDSWLTESRAPLGSPWCMAFAAHCFTKAGAVMVYPNLASVGFFEEWAKQHGYMVEKPARGDIVCYDWDSNGWPDHVGIVESVGGDYVVAVEGNTSFGDDSNGGQVMRRTRAMKVCKFVRIPGAAKGVPDWVGKADVLPPFWAWTLWKDKGSIPMWRPKKVPARVPVSWHARYLVHRFGPRKK